MLWLHYRITVATGQQPGVGLHSDKEAKNLPFTGEIDFDSRGRDGIG